MPLTAQQVADGLNARGIDTPAKFDAFIGKAGLLVERDRLNKRIETLRAGQAAASQQTEAEVQSVQAEIDAIEALLRGA